MTALQPKRGKEGREGGREERRKGGKAEGARGMAAPPVSTDNVHIPWAKYVISAYYVVRGNDSPKTCVFYLPAPRENDQVR